MCTTLCYMHDMIAVSDRPLDIEQPTQIHSHSRAQGTEGDRRSVVREDGLPAGLRAAVRLCQPEVRAVVVEGRGSCVVAQDKRRGVDTGKHESRPSATS